MIADVPLVEPALAARIAARALIDARAVHVRPREPFTYTSGLKSPVYVDCRRVIAYPETRSVLMGLMHGVVLRSVGLDAFDVVAGGETAGIAFAAWLAERMALPMVYVRKQPKGFGRLAQIEGELVAGQRVLLVEDLATDGGSKLAFARTLREAGASLTHTTVIFHHDIFPQSVERLAAEGLSLHALVRWQDVIDVLAERSGRDGEDLAEVRRFLDAPLSWSARHGGVDRLEGVA